MPGVVDADTHIIEHDGVFDFMDPEAAARRPVQVKAPSGLQYGRSNGFWLIDGKIVPKNVGKGSITFAVPAADGEGSRTDIPKPIREITDPEARVKTLDERDVDTEVVYPTMFLAYLTDDPVSDVAMARSYNRYMADVWKKGGGRLRWVVIPPLRSIPEAVEEVRWSKDHGAVGVFFRGVEGNTTLVEECFFPIYQAAMELDLAICIHTGAGSPTITSVFDRSVNHNLPQNRVLPVFAFRDIVAHKMPERFPGLRFGFIEASASWVPYVLHHLRRSHSLPIETGMAKPGVEDMWEWAPRLFKDYGLFVATEADEDIPYLLKFMGEDNIIIGSDFGHQDQSHEDNMVRVLRSREDVAPEAIEKILCDNPRRFYGL